VETDGEIFFRAFEASKKTIENLRRLKKEFPPQVAMENLTCYKAYEVSTSLI
jgi:hypothetical protein